MPLPSHPTGNLSGQPLFLLVMKYHLSMPMSAMRYGSRSLSPCVPHGLPHGLLPPTVLRLSWYPSMKRIPAHYRLHRRTHLHQSHNILWNSAASLPLRSTLQSVFSNGQYTDHRLHKPDYAYPSSQCTPLHTLPSAHRSKSPPLQPSRLPPLPSSN